MMMKDAFSQVTKYSSFVIPKLLHLVMEYKRKTRGKYPVFQPTKAIQGVSDVLLFHRIDIGYSMKCIKSSLVVWQMSTFILNVQIWVIQENFWVWQNSTLIPLQLPERQEMDNCGWFCTCTGLLVCLLLRQKHNTLLDLNTASFILLSFQKAIQESIKYILFLSLCYLNFCTVSLQ